MIVIIKKIKTRKFPKINIFYGFGNHGNDGGIF